mmetsp:Transcript_22525/g.22341  ORF Transcript_22525/g.22341 Transcript_22525/m.22341 type:complete len:119 (+) Transcript_22525:94-450(+)
MLLFSKESKKVWEANSNAFKSMFSCDKQKIMILAKAFNVEAVNADCTQIDVKQCTKYLQVFLKESKNLKFPPLKHLNLRSVSMYEDYLHENLLKARVQEYIISTKNLSKFKIEYIPKN